MTTNIQDDIVADGTATGDTSNPAGGLSGMMSKINNVRDKNPKLFYGVIVVLVVLLVFLYLKKSNKLPAMGKKKEGAGSTKKSKADKKLEALEDDVDEKNQIDDLIDSIEKKQQKNTGTVSRPE